jgi:hypothetical protein
LPDRQLDLYPWRDLLQQVPEALTIAGLGRSKRNGFEVNKADLPITADAYLAESGSREFSHSQIRKAVPV